MKKKIEKEIKQSEKILIDEGEGRERQRGRGQRKEEEGRKTFDAVNEREEEKPRSKKRSKKKRGINYKMMSYKNITGINGRPKKPYSLYVQVPLCTTLGNITNFQHNYITVSEKLRFEVKSESAINYLTTFLWSWNNRLVPNWEMSTSRLHIVTLLI